MTLRSHNGPARGRRGEQRHLKFLCDWRDTGAGLFCRPDFLWVPTRPVYWPPYVVEVKDQDAFEGPPFDGHGLTKTQFDVYIAAWRAINLGTLFVVYDDQAGLTYWDFLHDLAEGDTFVTAGPEPRIVFPLESFRFRRELR